MTKVEALIKQFEPDSEDCRTYREDLKVEIALNPSIKKIEAAMEEYAKDQMTTLIRNMAANPVSVFSKKVRGQEKQFFLGSKYVEDLIKRLNP